MASVCLANTIKISGTNMNNSANTFDLKKLFDSLDPTKDSDTVVYSLFEEDDDSGNRKHKPAAPRATFMDDPLALSCASYRIYQNEPARRFTNIDTVKATAEDRVHAQAIRDYYNQRYTMKALKGQRLTDYQQKAAQFLSGLYHLTVEEVGMLYKLPYFYDEDLAVEDIVKHTVSYDNTTVAVEQELTLTPYKKIHVTRKGASDFIHYYYQDQNQQAVVIMCPLTDRFKPMIEGLFNQASIRIKGFVFPTDIGADTKHFAKKLGNWELVL